MRLQSVLVAASLGLVLYAVPSSAQNHHGGGGHAGSVHQGGGHPGSGHQGGDHADQHGSPAHHAGGGHHVAPHVAVRSKRVSHGHWNRHPAQPATARRFDYNHPDPHFGRYDPARYYRSGPEYRLGRGDRIYRGYNGRYYCRRSNGTTGLIIGGIAGGVLGNAIANGQSQTIATLIGAGGGALLGQEIARGQVRCR